MIGLGTATTQLDTAVNIAFPAITRGFDLSIGDIQWVVICYVLAYASLLLALGRIGDSIGHAIVYRDRAGLERGNLPACRLCAELRRDAGFSLHAGCRRGTGAELRRGTGDKPLRRGTAQPGARHLHHDDGARPDARSPARRRAGGDLGLAGGVLVSHPDRDRGTAAVAWPAGVATARGTRSLRHPRRHRTGAGPGDDADGVQPHSRPLRRLARTAIRPGLCGLHLPAVPRGAADHRLRGLSPAGICDPEPRQRARQYRGLFGLAAGALLSDARERLFARSKAEPFWLRARPVRCWPRRSAAA